MVLRPTAPATTSSGPQTPVPAWDAVSRAQKQAASSWWLIAQPDHAALAGDLAANLSSPLFPQLGAEILEAIAVHDAGWAQFDSLQLPSQELSSQSVPPFGRVQGKRPLSFLDINPTDFLLAWIGSIERAARSSVLGGIMVSHHFSRIAQTRLRLADDPTEDRERIRRFLDGETARRRNLETQAVRPPAEIELLVDILQFCDLFSLYLCCGACEAVEFPQRFRSQIIRVHREDKMYVTTPAIFGRGVSLGVTARPFPPGSHPHHAMTIPFLLS